MKKIIFSLLFLSTLILSSSSFATKFSHQSKQKNLTTQLNELIQHRLPNANIGVVVMNANNGKVLYQKNGFQAFTPASNMKLFASSAALYYLGANYRYTTSVSIKSRHLNKHTLNGNLYITFTGDPSLKVKTLKKLIAQIKSYGINTIKGNIILDDTRFEKPYYAPGISIDDIKWSYAAPVTSIILNQNSVYVRLTPSQTLGKPVKVVPGKYTKYAKFSHQIKTVRNVTARAKCCLLIDINNRNDIDIRGCWPISAPTKHFNIAIKNPTLFATKIIIEQLRKNKIKLLGAIQTGKTPRHLKTIAKHQSKPLKQLLRHVLKNSNNLYAESITKTLGYKYYRHGSFQAGANVIKAILHKKTDIDFSKMVLVDGSGSRYNLATPRQITRLLYVVKHSPKISKLFIDSLPSAGRNGTLKSRLTSFDLAKHIRAKTGTMTGVSSLSGYLTTRHGKKLIFSIIVNHVVGSVRPAKSLQNEICNLLAHYG